MRQSLIPVLLLATVALSSSNVLPMFMTQLNKESLGLERQYNDNILSNKFKTRNILHEIYNLFLEGDHKPTSNKLHARYADADNNGDDDILGILDKNDNYDGEGFRQEQWHNYPRQLDRLHPFYTQNGNKKNFEPDPSKEYTEEVAPDTQDINEETNEFHVDSISDAKNFYDIAINANPLLVLKIRLACLNKDGNTCYGNLINSALEFNNLREDEKNEYFRNVNLPMDVIKVKREGVLSSQDNALTENSPKTVNKRIFSLWSRLQSLNHKGHELQHRRHLHAFYGLPDSDGGGTLTAETRATLMRPPGSPLRWG